MPYVMRNVDGAITAISLSEVTGWELVEDNAKDYVNFLQSALSEQDPFRESDIHLARVLEDVISLLIDRSLIRFTDFPAAAQKRLLDRQTLRKSNISLDIIDHGYDSLSNKREF